MAGLPEAALASLTRTTVKWNLEAATGEASRNRQAGRRSAQAGHSDSALSVFRDCWMEPSLTELNRRMRTRMYGGVAGESG
jgi:hypothetical protein